MYSLFTVKSIKWTKNFKKLMHSLWLGLLFLHRLGMINLMIRLVYTYSANSVPEWAGEKKMLADLTLAELI